MRVRVDPDRPAPRKLGLAIQAMQRDHVILYPTDTGYAFGCALSSRKGIAGIRSLKGFDSRSRKPLSMLVNELSDFGHYSIMDTSVFRTVRRILPGAYTIILEASADVPRDMRNRHGEIGLRMPDLPICRMLVEMLGEPIVTASHPAGDDTPELEDPE
jgi:tRNA threonylcarbamoyl adenosine modification protein (Sua5/YciO/YrdC/YwlC family)